MKKIKNVIAKIKTSVHELEGKTKNFSENTAETTKG